MSQSNFTSCKAFYPYYLAEHRDPRCRLMHFVGSTLVLCILVVALFKAAWVWLWLLPVAGYGFAWLGHALFEKNRPATFKHPWYSFLGDWVMYKDIVTGKLSVFR